jgi:anti-sigma-K factor RskA
VSNTDQTRDPFRELIGAYALGALDPEDRAAVAAHLATGCAECSKALGESQWLVSQLAYLAPEDARSEILRGRLLTTVREKAAAAKTKRGAAANSFASRGALAAVLFFAVYNAYEVRVTTNKVKEIRATLEQKIQLQQESSRQLALAQREALILTDPKSMWIKMSAADKNLPVLQATWHQQMGIVVSGWNLPAPSHNRTLQLWLIPKTPGAKPVPSMTLRPDWSGKFDLLVASPPDSPSATKWLAITEEPEGGSPQPTTTPIWVGAVSGK